MKIEILNLDKPEVLIYIANTPLQAMQNHLYSLNLSSKDINSKIEKSSKFLFLEHNGNTYCTPINQ